MIAGFVKRYFKPSLLKLRRLLLFVAPSFFLFNCTPNTDDVKDLMDLQNRVMTETGTGVEIVYTQNAIPSIKIVADEVVRYLTENPYMEFTSGFHLYMYDETGNLETTLTSNFAKMTDNSNELEARDSVVVLNRDGETLNTDFLIWDKEAEQIKSEGFVKITTKDEIIYGTGFVSDDKFTDYTIFNISGIVNIEEDF